MSEHKHTLGPWRCEYGEVRAEDKDGIVWAIAKVGKVIGEDEANARLIAAAPDMLAVLEDILPEIECRCGEAYTGRGLHESRSLCHHIEAAKAAIAKATGKEAQQ